MPFGGEGVRVAAQAFKELQLSSDRRPDGAAVRKDAAVSSQLSNTQNVNVSQWKTTKKRRREYESRADKEEGETLFHEKTNLLDCSHKVKIPNTVDEEFHFNIGS